MERVVVVGSGASGVHFALSALQKGCEVVMVDVGHPAPAAAAGDLSFVELKTRLADPVRFFLGERYEAVVHPRVTGEYYGLPPSKSYIFAPSPHFEWDARGFAPLFSFAAGGLAQAWTGGVYPLNDGELRGFPLRYRDLEPYYGVVAARIGVTGARDDLLRFLPWHDHLAEPLRLDRHSASLVAAYERHRTHVTATLRCYLGRSRVAVLGEDREGRGACTYLGRCLWGCPRSALYTPALTLAECRRFPAFTHVTGLHVTHLERGPRGRIARAVARRLDGGGREEIRGDRFALAAGTLGSSAIYLRSIREATGESVALSGLMDNRQVLVPFLTLRMVGRPYEPEAYQYHQLALGLEGAEPAEYVHGQITTLKGALIHPIVHNVPLDLRGALALVRRVRTGLGVVNINLHDTRRPENRVSLAREGADGGTRLVIDYRPPADEPQRLRRALRTVRRCLRALGCVVPPGMTHVRPMGASVHYAGTLPMSTDGGDEGPHRTTRAGRSSVFENLFVVDGASMPFLPAKNLTFTLMANAARVAEEGL
jgi:choline dehydrogenase-like flavoprotein